MIFRLVLWSFPETCKLLSFVFVERVREMSSRPYLSQLVQMIQPCEDHVFAGLFNLAREKDFIQNRVDLLEE